MIQLNTRNQGSSSSVIELSCIHIDDYNDIIATRNKVYRLVLDLKMHINTATYLAMLTSEITQSLLVEQNKSDVKFIFTQQLGCYNLHILISCTPVSKQILKDKVFFHSLVWRVLADNVLYIEFIEPIIDSDFRLEEQFIQSERERLIQQSSGDMLQEIRKKNDELKKALQDLQTSTGIQAEKMRALGCLAASVAHEINNPMMGIMNFIQYAIKHTTSDDKRYKPLVAADRELARCQDIITNLLTFSYKSTDEENVFSMIKPSVLFDRVLELYAYKLRDMDVKVMKRYSQDEREVSVNVNKMQQVILNLVTNALDAMNDRSPKELSLNLDFQTEWVTLSVCDTGSGMSEDTQNRIFEPFFTTKSLGKGVGLGLAVAKKIVEENNGHLTYHSRLNYGTCFMVTLPIAPLINNEVKLTNEQ